MLRTQDYSALKHNEDNHSTVQHVRIQDDRDKAEDTIAHSVRSKDDADGTDTHHDARDEGKNKYVNLRKKKKEDPGEEGIVIAKSRGGFDLKI